MSGRHREFAAFKPQAPPIAASSGKVTSFPRHGGARSLAKAWLSALASDGDVLVAAAAWAVSGGFRYRAGNFLRVDTAVRRGLRKIA